MKLKKLKITFFLLLIWTVVSSAEKEPFPDFVEEVYLTPQEAFEMVFPKGTNVQEIERSLTSEEKKRIEKRLRWKLTEDKFFIYHGEIEEEGSGWAIIMEEIGKFKPITFIVKVSEKGKIERVEVLVYRESVGREVKRQRFLRQFKGKTSKDPLRINRDIINVTGATLSVRGVSSGVKKALVILDELGYIPHQQKRESSP